MRPAAAVPGVVTALTTNERAAEAIAIVYAVAGVSRPVGDGFVCVFCGAAWLGYSQTYECSICDHGPFCPWVAARKFTGRPVP